MMNQYDAAIVSDKHSGGSRLGKLGGLARGKLVFGVTKIM